MAATFFVIKLPKQESCLSKLERSTSSSSELLLETTPNSDLLLGDNTTRSFNNNVSSTKLCETPKIGSPKSSNDNTITTLVSNNIDVLDQEYSRLTGNDDVDMQIKISGLDIKGQDNNKTMALSSSVLGNLSKVPPQLGANSQGQIAKPQNRFQVTPIEEPGHEMLDFIPKETPETMVKDILEESSVKNDIWTDSDAYKQITFIDCGAPARIEYILKRLMAIGIGQKLKDSSISVFPASIHVETFDPKNSKEESNSIKKENESNFKKSVKSRLVVAQVVDSVHTGAVFTFDYCMLIILASMISVIGLVENSSVVLVASMLISPLMGPILAGTFGIVIQNYSLRNLGLRSESIGLALCIICGFIFGLIIGSIQLQGMTGYIDEWPTMEMKSRGMGRSLLFGILIALPSGAGVSLSVLGGNSGPLVGVAISASLLPPAVNAGMLWSFALLSVISPPKTTPHDNTTAVSINAHPLGCLPFQDNAYTPMYSCDMAKEMGIMGTISLLLTLLNIVCIFLVGVVMLKMKEFVPLASTDKTAEFWGHDIKVARDTYKTVKGPECQKLLEKERNEFKLRCMNQLSGDPTGKFDSSSKVHETKPNNKVTHDNTHTLHDSKFPNPGAIELSPGVRVAQPLFPTSPEHIPVEFFTSRRHFSYELQHSRSNSEEANDKHQKFRLEPLFHVVGKEKMFTVTPVPDVPNTHPIRGKKVTK
ncbi:uncharacterized protein LOC115215006 [Octopus sinensis]|uniref:Uncharacterized protein LOC115215006 n=1 Tax=Octopus sinensis TaxID=2607531 RepID=A0A6P7SNW0_9MOLL|nr:uncharacterized protein LOC115215006 [Octopus sinensis]